MVTLVTGATGFIGRRLMQQDHRAMVRCAAGFKHEVIGDLRDRHSLEIACDGIKVVFHCAGHAHLPTSSPDDIHHEVNYQGVKNLLYAAGRAGVRRFIFLSSVKAMAEPGEQCVDEDWPGAPTSQYGLAKRAAEEAVLEMGELYGMHVVNLRLAMVYGRGVRGNFDRLVRGLGVGWFPVLPETGNRRSLVHVQDVVTAIRVVADRPEANQQTYIVADPVSYSGRELCDAIRSVKSARGFSWSVPAWALRFGGKMGDLSGQLFCRQMPINSEVVSRLLDSECYSPALIESDLGWRAKICLTDGLGEMLGTTERNR